MSLDAYTVAIFVLDISARAAAAALAVAIVLRLFRVGAPGLRHAAWTTVLAAMLLMPLLPSIVPALPVPLALPRDVGAPVERSSAPVTSEAAAPVTVTGLPVPQRGETVRVESIVLTPPPQAPRPVWPLVVFGIYVGGVLLFAARLLYGSYLVARMIGRGRRIGGDSMRAGAPVVDSPDVAVPMTAGAFHPVIVLPADGQEWPAAALAAVLAHDGAHARRRDALAAFISRVTRVIFWFHPLAWWLERHLAITAEHVCDEAAAREIREPRRYAEILLEMGDVVR